MYKEAGSLATKHVLPVAVVLWLLNRVTCPRGGAQSVVVRLKFQSALLSLGTLLLYRPLKACLRVLHERRKLIPVIPGQLPLFGHLFEVLKFPDVKPGIGGVWDYFVHLHANLGHTFRVVVGPEFAPVQVMTFTTDPANVEHILKHQFENYGKGSKVEDVFEEFLGKGIFVVDGARWKTQRKIAAGIFTRKNFSQNMTHVFQVHARRLVSVLQRQTLHNPSKELDLQRLFFSLTLDAFCEIGFGFSFNSLEASGTSGSEDQQSHWAQHFDRAQAIIVNRFAYRPAWRLERFLSRCKMLPSSHEEVQMTESVDFLNRFVQQLLDQRFAEDKAGFDLLSMFMETTQDRKYLRDIVMNFIIAGRDTTACTLTWLFWELARCPQAYEKAHDEVLQEVGGKASAGREHSQDLGFDDLSRLKYCTACIRETVRLHPPVPVDPKVAFGDDVLPDGSIISKGDYVFYGPYQMARDLKIWGEDAAEWRPERWLEMESEPSTFVNCAFQAGPRICLGREMAVLEAKAVLAQVLLSGLRWEVRSGYSPTYKYPSIVMPMADPGLPVRVHSKV